MEHVMPVGIGITQSLVLSKKVTKDTKGQSCLETAVQSMIDSRCAA